MSELITTTEPDIETLPDMTRQEAEESDRLIRQSEGMKRIRVYLMHLRKGYQKLGYDTFDAYCEDRIDTPRTTAYEWIRQVEMSILAGNISLRNLYALRTNEIENVQLLPQTATRELAKLKSDPVKLKQAYDEYNGVAVANHSQTSLLALKRIVKEKLRRMTPASPSRPDPLEQKMQEAAQSENLTIETPEQANNGQSVPAVSGQAAQKAAASQSPVPPPDDPDEQETDEPAERIQILNARAVQLDAGKKSLFIDVQLRNGQLVSVRVPFALLPRECQP